MKNTKTIKAYHKLSFIFALGLSLHSVNQTHAHTLPIETSLSIRVDSIGQENINGKRYIIHKLAAKETYYQLSRIYGVPMNEIMEANNKKNLRVGDNVRIPKGLAIVEKKAPVVQQDNKKENPILINPNEITEYRVGKSETLYAISRRFSISVGDIKRINNLTSDNLRENQILKIPNNSLPPIPEPVIDTPIIAVTPPRSEDDEPEPPFKGNKYGIRETKEKGVGVWMNDLETNEQTSLALHKTAPIGTILKITNPMNRSVTFAKVVGKFNDNHDTQGAIVILSKSVASSIGILDKRFQVEITYGVPLN